MILVSIAATALAVWLYLAMLHGGFWRSDQRLEPAPEPRTWPGIVAVIPARNEAESIGEVVAAHLAANYPGQMSLTVVDDASSDGTAEIARARAPNDERLKVISAPPLREGWTGKLSAQAAGLAEARKAAPEASYVLLTDADIRLDSGTLTKLVAKAEDEHLALNTLMARLDCRGVWAELLIPAFVYFFQMLYPFRRANEIASKVAAAAGGCMLVRLNALDNAGGLESIRGCLIDDCALAARLKFHGDGAPRKTWIGIADDEAVSLRDNSRLDSIWNMVARTAFTQLNHSWIALAATLAGMVLVYVAPPLIAIGYPVHGNGAAGVLALGAWLTMAATYQPTIRLYGLAAWRTALLPPAALLYAAMTLSSAFRHLTGKGGRWKGRSYPRVGAK